MPEEVRPLLMRMVVVGGTEILYPGSMGTLARSADLAAWDVPVKKHGAKLLRALSGSAKAVVNEVDVSQILCEEGIDNILACLKSTMSHTWSRRFQGI